MATKIASDFVKNPIKKQKNMGGWSCDFRPIECEREYFMNFVLNGRWDPVQSCEIVEVDISNPCERKSEKLQIKIFMAWMRLGHDFSIGGIVRMTIMLPLFLEIIWHFPVPKINFVTEKMGENW